MFYHKREVYVVKNVKMIEKTWQSNQKTHKLMLNWPLEAVCPFSQDFNYNGSICRTNSLKQPSSER